MDLVCGRGIIYIQIINSAAIDIELAIELDINGSRIE